MAQFFALPRRFDLVVCKITKIDPHSASAEIIDYKTTGLIHASEVASRWVRDIREFLKEGQYVVCRVMEVDRQNNYIALSIKRVSREETSRKLTEFKKEQKAEKVIEIIAKNIGKTLDIAKEEVIPKLLNEFGSLQKALEFAQKDKDLFRRKGLQKSWSDAIIEHIEKNTVEKVHEVSAKLSLACYKSDGVEVIKKVLTSPDYKSFEIRYISAPKYMITAKGTNYKELRAKLLLAAESIVREINKNNGEASFEVIEK